MTVFPPLGGYDGLDWKWIATQIGLGQFVGLIGSSKMDPNYRHLATSAWWTVTLSCIVGEDVNVFEAHE